MRLRFDGLPIAALPGGLDEQFHRAEQAANLAPPSDSRGRVAPVLQRVSIPPRRSRRKSAVHPASSVPRPVRGVPLGSACRASGDRRHRRALPGGHDGDRHADSVRLVGRDELRFGKQFREGHRGVVEHHDVDIARIIELVRSHLAHGEHDVTAVRFRPRRVGGDQASLSHGRAQEIAHRRTQRRVGKFGQRRSGVFMRGEDSRVAPAAPKWGEAGRSVSSA